MLLLLWYYCTINIVCCFVVVLLLFYSLLTSHLAPEPEIRNTSDDVQQSIMFAMGSTIEPQTIERTPSIDDKPDITANVVTDCMYNIYIYFYFILFWFVF